MNRYRATLIQDTSDFLYFTRDTITQVLAYPLPDGSAVSSTACFFTWLIAHQIERVFGLTCEGHNRRHHPNVQLADQIRNLIDLDAITKANLVVPKIFDDQVLEVDLWYNDLVIRYCDYPPYDPRSRSWKKVSEIVNKIATEHGIVPPIYPNSSNI